MNDLWRTLSVAIVASFPGGGIDACRPLYEARRVELGARRGYVRLALDLGVPIVPLATIGSHHTYTMLPGGTTIARIARMKRWARTEGFPLVLGTVVALAALALCLLGVLPGWVVGLAVLCMVVPNPARVTTEVLPPIEVSAMTAHIIDGAARVEAAHDLVSVALGRAVATVDHEGEARDEAVRS